MAQPAGTRPELTEEQRGAATADTGAPLQAAQDNHAAGEDRGNGRRRRGRRGGERAERAERRAESSTERNDPNNPRTDRIWYPRKPFVPQPDARSAVPGPNAMAAEEEIVRETAQDTAPLSTPYTPFVPQPQAETVVPDVMHSPAVVAAPDTMHMEAASPAPVRLPAPEQAAPVSAALPADAPAAPAPALKIEWPSDLQQIETKAGRVQDAQASGDDGAPRRVKRARPAPPPVVQEPLQQVETRH